MDSHLRGSATRIGEMLGGRHPSVRPSHCENMLGGNDRSDSLDEAFEGRWCWLRLEVEESLFNQCFTQYLVEEVPQG